MKIVIEMEVKAPLGVVWDAWVAPEDIVQWNFAVDEWCCPRAELDFQVGGKFNYRMEAKDASAGFDFEGEFTEISPFKLIRYRLGEEREVEIRFMEGENGIKVVEKFVAEDENSAEQQRQGWLGILKNFKKHVESKCNVQ